MNNQQEEKRLKALLKGKSIKDFHRHRPNELLIIFEDGGRMFIDAKSSGKLEISITGCETIEPE